MIRLGGKGIDRSYEEPLQVSFPNGGGRETSKNYTGQHTFCLKVRQFPGYIWGADSKNGIHFAQSSLLLETPHSLINEWFVSERPISYLPRKEASLTIH